MISYDFVAGRNSFVWPPKKNAMGHKETPKDRRFGEHLSFY